MRERLTYRDAYSKTPMWTNRANAACPNFRLELKKSSVREVYMYVCFGKERRARGGASEERKKEHGSKTASLETASELKKKLLTFTLYRRQL